MLHSCRLPAPASARGMQLRTSFASARRSAASTSSRAKASAQPASTTTAYPPLLPLNDNYEAIHAFTPYANWLLPGSIMLGRYPFVEPSRCLRKEDGEAQLEAILMTGITTFVCLQGELPPQEQLRLAGKDGFLPYKATAELIAAALDGPPPMEDLHALRTPALDKFLPPKRGSKPTAAAAPAAPPRPSRNLNFVHYPITDLGVPTSEQLKTIVADLKQRLAAGERLYIHCWGGRGRAGTVGACLLAAAYGLSEKEALERVQRAFDTRRDENRRSPETEAQLAFVRDYVACGCS